MPTSSMCFPVETGAEPTTDETQTFCVGLLSAQLVDSWTPQWAFSELRDVASPAWESSASTRAQAVSSLYCIEDVC